MHLFRFRNHETNTRSSALITNYLASLLVSSTCVAAPFHLEIYIFSTFASVKGSNFHQPPLNSLAVNPGGVPLPWSHIRFSRLSAEFILRARRTKSADNAEALTWTSRSHLP